MWWTYAVVATIFTTIGFMLCAILSANKYNKEFVSIDGEDKKDE